MPTNILMGDTVRVQVTFRDWQSFDDEGAVVDPVTVDVDILDANMNRTVTEEEAVGNDGIYHYDWLPAAPGVWYLEFKGLFPDGQTAVIREEFEVSETPLSATTPGAVLGEDQEIFFSTSVTPLYVDPEELKGFFPEAGTVEIMEAIHRYSMEVEKIFKGGEPTFTALEYIRAAALCALSRIYDYGVDGDEASISLGDLSFTSRSFPKMTVTRANASGWCELAGALRQEVIRSSTGGMRAVVKGTKYRNPMPHRRVRDKEEPGGTRWPN